MARHKKRSQKGKSPGGEDAQKLTQIKLGLPYLREVVANSATRPLTAQEHADLSASLETLAWVTAVLENRNATLVRLRRALFGGDNESMRKLLGSMFSFGPEEESEEASEALAWKGEQAPTGSDEHGTAPAVSLAARETAGPEGEAGGEVERSGGEASGALEPAPEARPRRKGHGRIAASRYTGAKRCPVSHESLSRGQVCPACEEGKVYPLATPAVLVRIEGIGPLVGTVYELERLRCNRCGMVFTARPPEGVGVQKYDESVTAMVALLRYGCGMPLHRLSRLQTLVGLPFPSSTAFELVEGGADALEALWDALIWEAAQGQVLYNDDTWVRILKVPEPLEPLEGEDRSERTGLFTTGVLSEVDGRRIALYFTGRQHAGENLREVLLRRAEGLSPPIQMSDALSRNGPRGLETIQSTCLTHYLGNAFIWREQFNDASSLQFVRDLPT